MIRKSTSRVITVMLLSICTAGLFMHLLMPDSAWSQAENRPLQGFPAYDASGIMNGSSMAQTDTYWADQMPGRETFFHINYLFRKYTGTTLLNGVFLGHNDLLGKPAEIKGSVWQNNLQAMQDFAASSDLPSAAMVIPTAAAVQTDRLPANAEIPDENDVLDQLAADSNVQTDENGKETVSSAGQKDLQIFDLRDLLDVYKDEYIFYKSDHHWTSLGAGLASMAYLDTLDQENRHSLEDYTFMPVSHSFEGTLASKSGSVDIFDTIEIAPAKENPDYMVTWADGTASSSIYDLDALDQKDQYQLFLGPNQSVVNIETTNTNGRHLLLVKDSYANSMIQFLLPQYQSITVVDPRYFYDDLDVVLSMNAINEVLFVFGYDNYVTDSSLKDVLDTCSFMPHTTDNAEDSQTESSDASGS